MPISKRRPLGICDHCGAPMPTHTVKEKIRRFCSVRCRNTANSRAGNAERTRKLRERVARGEWQNPATLRPPTPEEQAARARRGRLREVAAGVWRNPALSDAARAKLSRPRKTSGALADAIEKLRKGNMADLSPDEADAYRAHARARQAALRASWTDEERAEARRKWREAWRRRQ